MYACRDKQARTQQSKCATGIHVGQTETYPSSERPPPSSLMLPARNQHNFFFLKKILYFLFLKFRESNVRFTRLLCALRNSLHQGTHETKSIEPGENSSRMQTWNPVISSVGRMMIVSLLMRSFSLRSIRGSPSMLPDSICGTDHQGLARLQAQFSVGSETNAVTS